MDVRRLRLGGALLPFWLAAAGCDEAEVITPGYGEPPAAGGSAETGGAGAATGGDSSGGAPATGGAGGSGGATGGSSSTGGVAPTGGAAPAGGTLATGGTVATGGGSPTGGTWPTGGTGGGRVDADCRGVEDGDDCEEFGAGYVCDRTSSMSNPRVCTCDGAIWSCVPQ